MLIATMASVLLLSSSGAKPAGPPKDTYSERWLCDLWSGAQCHATSCQKDGKERCLASAKQCKETSRTATVSKDRAEKQAACARALLKADCGGAKPAECDGLI
jgi:hypothetical protein